MAQNTVYITINNGQNSTFICPTTPVVNILASGGITAVEGFTNPMTTLGDTLYEDGTPAATRLPGNISTTRKFLSQTGTGIVSAAPIWAQINSSDILTTFTPGSVIWVDGSSQFAQDNANFYWGSGAHQLSVATNNDFTGTDSINTYKQIDAYMGNSTIGGITVDNATPGFTASSSRGTGQSPLINNSGDLIGGFSMWAYTGAAPSYTPIAGGWAFTSGTVSNNLGGEYRIYTKADGGALTQNLTVSNSGVITFNTGYGSGIIRSSASGVLSSSTIVSGDLSNGIITYPKLQNESASTLLGNPSITAATPSEISLGATLAFSGGYLQTTSFSGDITTPVNSFVATISSNAVTYGKFQQVAAYSLIGNPTATTANSQGITLGPGLSFSGGALQAASGYYWLLASGGALTGSNTITGAFPVNFSNNQVIIAQPSLSGSAPTAFSVTPGAHTVLTSATEYNAVVLNGVSLQWASGTFDTQRDIRFTGYAHTGASATASFNKIYTAYFDLPTIGANASVATNSTYGYSNLYALGVSRDLAITVGANNLATLHFFYPSYGSGTSMGYISLNAGSGEQRFYVSSGGYYQTFYANGSEVLRLNAQGSILIGSTSNNAKLYVVQAATTGSPVNVVRIDPGAHTLLTAGTEYNNIVVNTVTQQWATGGLTTNRSLWVKSPTIAFVGASTVTNAFNAYFDPPLPGTNATITNPYAVGVNGKMWIAQTTNLATPSDGTLEYNGTHLFINIGSTRYQLDQQSGGGGGGVSIVSQSVTTSSTLPSAANTIYNIWISASGGNIVVTLPTATSSIIYNIKRTDNSSTTVTFSGTIDGSSAYLGTTGLLPLNGFTLMNDGTNYWAL